jgi:hypothetical protein
MFDGGKGVLGFGRSVTAVSDFLHARFGDLKERHRSRG